MSPVNPILYLDCTQLRPLICKWRENRTFDASTQAKHWVACHGLMMGPLCAWRRGPILVKKLNQLTINSLHNIFAEFAQAQWKLPIGTSAKIHHRNLGLPKKCLPVSAFAFIHSLATSVLTRLRSGIPFIDGTGCKLTIPESILRLRPLDRKWCLMSLHWSYKSKR